MYRVDTSKNNRWSDINNVAPITEFPNRDIGGYEIS